MRSCSVGRNECSSWGRRMETSRASYPLPACGRCRSRPTRSSTATPLRSSSRPPSSRRRCRRASAATTKPISSVGRGASISTATSTSSCARARATTTANTRRPRWTRCWTRRGRRRRRWTTQSLRSSAMCARAAMRRCWA